MSELNYPLHHRFNIGDKVTCVRPFLSAQYGVPGETYEVDGIQDSDGVQHIKCRGLSPSNAQNAMRFELYEPHAFGNTFVVEGMRPFPMQWMEREKALPFGRHHAYLLHMLTIKGGITEDMTRLRLIYGGSGDGPDVREWAARSWRVMENHCRNGMGKNNV